MSSLATGKLTFLFTGVPILAPLSCSTDDSRRRDLSNSRLTS